MKQLMVRTQLIPAGETIARYVLEARALQAPHILGYKMDLVARSTAGFNDKGDLLVLTASLLAAPRTTTAVPTPGDLLLDGLNKTRGLIGYLSYAKEIVGPTGASVVLDATQESSGWVPCDFMVPGLWIALSNSPVSNSATGMVTLTLLFDWVSLSAIALAALYTTYGIDSVDAAERQAGPFEVDFNRAMGEGALPPLVG